MQDYKELLPNVIYFADQMIGNRDEYFIEELRSIDRLIQRMGGQLISRQVIAAHYIDYKWRQKISRAGSSALLSYPTADDI